MPDPTTKFNSSEKIYANFENGENRYPSKTSSMNRSPAGTISKIKTELCKNWVTKGKCRYKNFCMYAHGNNELRDREYSSGYKTRYCENFHKKFACLYGSRCQFIHSTRRFYSTKIENKHNYDYIFEDTLNGIAKGKRLKFFDSFQL